MAVDSISMNTSINSGDGGGYTADTIRYDDSSLSTIKTAISEAESLLNLMQGQALIMARYDSKWEGEAKKVYQDLKNFLNQYLEDFESCVENLDTAISGLETLLSNIKSANVIKEIENA